VPFGLTVVLVAVREIAAAAVVATELVACSPVGKPLTVGVSELVVVTLPEGILTCDGTAYGDVLILVRLKAI
jgi:hypothetical protein